MKRIVFIVLIITCFVQVTSCKPTPKEPFVVNKNDGKLEAIINAKPVKPGQYNAPKTWKETIPASENSGKIIVDAKITVPAVKKYPVYQVESPYSISQEYANALLNYFASDNKLYKNEAPVPTKNDIIQEIMKIETEINDPDSEFNTVEKSQVSAREFEIMLNYRKERIKQLEREYAQAPEVAKREEVSREFSPVYDDRGNFSGYYTIDDITDDRVYFTIRSNKEKRDKAGYAAVALFAKGGEMTPEARFSSIDDMNGLKCSLPEAEKKAASLLKDLKKNSYEMQLATAVTAYQSESKPGDTIFSHKRAYRLYYTRKIDGIPCLIEFNSRHYIEYSDPWPQELISVGVSDDGVCYYSESALFELGERLNENVPLLEFDKIQQKFRDYIAISASYFGQDDNATYNVTIDDIRLGFYMIRKKNNAESGYLIPVWMFYGNEVWHYSKPQEGGVQLDENNNYTPYDNIAHAYLCINAIDGSIIDLTSGY